MLDGGSSSGEEALFSPGGSTGMQTVIGRFGISVNADF